MGRINAHRLGQTQGLICHSGNVLLAEAGGGPHAENRILKRGRLAGGEDHGSPHRRAGQTKHRSKPLHGLADLLHLALDAGHRLLELAVLREDLHEGTAGTNSRG